MKKVILFLALFVLSCNSDDSDTFSIIGKTYKLTSYTLEHSFDLNNDNIYSYNLFDEVTSTCFQEPMYFLNLYVIC